MKQFLQSPTTPLRMNGKSFGRLRFTCEQKYRFQGWFTVDIMLFWYFLNLHQSKKATGCMLTVLLTVYNFLRISEQICSKFWQQAYPGLFCRGGGDAIRSTSTSDESQTWTLGLLKHRASLYFYSTLQATRPHILLPFSKKKNIFTIQQADFSM